MEFQKVIESRRSIRKYDPNQKVTKTQIEEMVKAAMLAPTWKNSQTARYYCVISDEMFEKVRTECLPAFNANNSARAGALIATAFVRDISGYGGGGEPANELENGWGIYDLGLANENLILKAEEMGLGTLVMGIRDGEKLRRFLKIPENETLVSVIAVGYAAAAAKMPARKSLEDIAVFL